MSDETLAIDPTQAASDHFASIRSDAAKAVEEAIKAETAKEPAAPAEDPEAPDEPAVAKAEPEAGADEPESGEPAPAADEEKSIARILKQREKAATAKTDAQKALEEARAAADEARKAREELAKEREELAREKAKLSKLKNVQNAPEALKELGWEPDDFIAAAARAKTPEGRLEALVRAQAEELAALKSKADAWEKQGEEQKATAQRQADESRIKEIESAFVKTALDVEKYPALAKRYAKGRHPTLLFEAHDVARQYRAATGGEEATFDQIAAYLESLEHDDGEATTEDAGKQKASKNGKAQPAGRPPGKRTLTSTDSSERRSVPAVDKTDDLDELRKRARAAAEKAIRESA